MAAREITKHREIYDRIHNAILTGEYGVGERIPTEAELGASYHVSRPTISRALRELERQGYLVRRRGAGTFVCKPRESSHGLFAITIPQTEGGVLAPVCAEISRQAEMDGHAVIFAGAISGDSRTIGRRVEAFAEQCIARKVVGVFFLPLIVQAHEMQLNEQIAMRLERTGIPIVLLDRDICDYPRRSRYDLVGVDNRRNGFIITEHLLKLGHRNVQYIGLSLAASTVTARAAGYRDALLAHGIEPKPEWVHCWDWDHDTNFVRNLMRNCDADAFVCVNDDVARALMHHLAILGIRVPDDVGIVGFDDVPFARALPVPLTTLHQPARQIGAVAVQTMLSRLANPDLPARDIMLACDLRVRSSCGATRQVATQSAS